MAKKLLDLVKGATGIDHTAPESVPELMASHPPVQPRSLGQLGDSDPDRVRRHRGPDWLSEQID
jgi:hypothetical protein